MPEEISRRTLVQGIAASSVSVVMAGCALAPGGGGVEVEETTPSGGPGDGGGRVPMQLEEYPRMRVASLDEIGEEPLSFEYPLESQTNFVVKLGERANGGVGPDDDIVAFSYACSHMGCSLEGTYKGDYAMLGSCPCHLSRFDLTNYGMVVDGVATQSLPMIVLDIDADDDVYATGVMGLLYGYRNNLGDDEPSQGVKEALDVADSPDGSDGDQVDFGGWFDDVDNFDGVVDETGRDEVSVAVGAQGNDGAFAFEPAAVRVDAGTTVVWEWTGNGNQHNVAEEDGAFESDLTAEEGFTFEHLFEGPGTFRYVCVPHRTIGMKGAVVVE